MRSRRTVWLMAVAAGAGLVAGLGAVAWGQGGVTVIRPGENKAPAAEAPAAVVPAPAAIAPAGAAPGGVPVGAVVAWMKSLPGTPPLSEDWAECNGQVLQIDGSPYSGQKLPDLNGAAGEPRRFLRGSTSSGGTGGSETHEHPPFLTSREGARTVNVSARRPSSNLPPFYEVTWIMRVR